MFRIKYEKITLYTKNSRILYEQCASTISKKLFLTQLGGGCFSSKEMVDLMKLFFPNKWKSIQLEKYQKLY